jgi:predicted TIM-barrel fold metal-dependent hydrolase
MAAPLDEIGIVDTLIGFPASDFTGYDRLRVQLKDAQSRDDFDFPVEYMFRHVPKHLYGTENPIDVTLHEMDRFGVEWGLVGCRDEVGQKALRDHPDRFLATGGVYPHDSVDGLRRMERQYEEFGVRSFDAFPSGFNPQVPIDDPKMYPIYAKCVELDVPIFVCAGVPGPRFPMSPQKVERIDQVMYDFPELVFVTRHGCEPWDDLAVKLMLKWPGLHYSTSAFAPRHYPDSIVHFANTRGADKILYGGYFPMGMSLERIMGDMDAVGFKDSVWPGFLRGNAARLLKIDG